MRVNIYAEELTTDTELVVKHVSDEEFGERDFYGVRVYMHSANELHHGSADDDRSAVTFFVPWTRAGGHEFGKLIDVLIQLMGRVSDGAETERAREREQLNNAYRGVSITTEEKVAGYSVVIPRDSFGCPACSAAIPLPKHQDTIFAIGKHFRDRHSDLINL